MNQDGINVNGINENEFKMTERDENGQIVLDSNQNPMKALTYYFINGTEGYQYLGQWSKNKNLRGIKKH